MNFKKTFKHFTDSSWEPVGQITGPAGDAEKTFTQRRAREHHPARFLQDDKVTRLSAPGFSGVWLQDSADFALHAEESFRPV